MHNSGHFTADLHECTPPELEALVLKVQRHAYFTKHLAKEQIKQKGQKDFFNLEEQLVIMNGILCPVWNMPKCKYNELRGCQILRKIRKLCTPGEQPNKV
jgi:hypothetical protein